MFWFEEHPERFAVEAALLRRQLGAFQFVKKDGCLRVPVRLQARRGEYVCEIVYPAAFPWAEIDTFIRSPKLERSPHQFSGGSGRICTHHSGDVTPETTAVTYLTWAREWIRRYEEYLDGRGWRD